MHDEFYDKPWFKTLTMRDRQKIEDLRQAQLKQGDMNPLKDVEDRRKIVSEAGYVLFYRRRD